MPANGGGQAKQLTFHSADDSVLAWRPNSKQILFSSNRGEEFVPRPHTISPDFGMYGTYSPDGNEASPLIRSSVRTVLISTSSDTLIDRSTIRMPGSGV